MDDITKITGNDGLLGGSFNEGTGQLWDHNGQTTGKVDGGNFIRDQDGTKQGWISDGKVYNNQGIQTGTTDRE